MGAFTRCGHMTVFAVVFTRIKCRCVNPREVAGVSITLLLVIFVTQQDRTSVTSRYIERLCGNGQSFASDQTPSFCRRRFSFAGHNILTMCGITTRRSQSYCALMSDYRYKDTGRSPFISCRNGHAYTPVLPLHHFL